MKVIIATCSAVYTGRGDTRLEPRKRAIVIKDDGAVSIHSGFANKPLNYMNAPNQITWEDDGLGNEVMIVDTRKESLQITIHEVHAQFEHELDPDEPGLIRDGTENHLSEYLSRHPELFGAGYTLVQREFRTSAGAVDILFQHADGHHLVVEVKRIAMLGAVDQVIRYTNALADADPADEFDDVRGMIVALDVRPACRALAEKRGIAWMEVERPESGLGKD